MLTVVKCTNRLLICNCVYVWKMYEKVEEKKLEDWNDNFMIRRIIRIQN